MSGMLRKLAEVGLLEHEPYRGVRLTDEGRRVALEVLRHHRLLELFLAQELGMSWDRVHAEAEVLEHVLSEDLEELIAGRLGDPAVEPHGDPIPTVRLRSTSVRHRALTSWRSVSSDVACTFRTPTRRCCATSQITASRSALVLR